MELILSNLQEAIISKANHRIGFCNIKGTHIVNHIGTNEIQGFKLEGMSSNSLFQSGVLNAKVFMLYENDSKKKDKEEKR